ncbi:carbamoyltransferase HypF [Desulfosporosinus sp. PR]|uniref:carbamoyltransferase HypF n=1 Tax=Candidatus Desulfosporosinus nitrosoreducens TaxID=3401928 RepID=UPI0027F4CEF2|nr:carbamoyltransferase HypF [Desulfosporosinus sp. PR]MDQ7095496.1 carbamoyltransferase HypF [Desulfosporosinus sp. PR]
MNLNAKKIYLNGIVQGVGFRPFVFNLAEELSINGWVNNSSQGVTIHAEGENLDLFYERLFREAPPLAKILIARSQEVPPENYRSFRITPSETLQEADVLISPDVATCQECLRDMADKNNRRFRYPFTNCTNCGPRYTIIRDVPYDRSRTTMSKFAMCRSCSLEYQNPRDRRFHAQPVACGECGPTLRLLDASGQSLPGIGAEQLAQGSILAVKGLGGFHLVCDARNEQAVDRLRERKERGAKPFALMARSIEKAREEVVVRKTEEELLLSTAAPIVILERKPGHAKALPETIAPGIHTLGLMLPYTPIHHLLFEGSYDFLVMTSANLSGRPLIYTDEEALAALQGIADYFLLHDRDIYHPCDDSVVQVIGEAAVFFRRARGYVPLPLLIPSSPFKRSLLGVGGDLKNAFCLAAGERAFVSQYLGDLEGYETMQRFHQELESFQRVVNIVPMSIAYDRHPNYHSARFAQEQVSPKASVQHHHAHLVSVLGEWERQEPTLGVICDGTGFGEDHCIWGFEVLYGNASGYERKGHLEYLPLPGGDMGIKHPLRIAYAYLKTLLSAAAWQETKPFWKTFSQSECQVLDRQIERGIQVVQTSSAGRLFDAVSGLLGICTKVTYEGQAAIELESAAAVFAKQFLNEKGLHKKEDFPIYPYEVRLESPEYILEVGPLFAAMVRDVLAGVARGEIAYRFHHTIARAIVDLALKFQAEGPLVLSGGVFQNKLLTEVVLRNFEQTKVKVLRSRALPPGDGGLAFGQVLIANEVL